MDKAGMKPIELEPVYRKSIWAGDRLKKIRGLLDTGIGISREVCAYRGSENRIAAGPMRGEYIGRLISDCRRELMGLDESGQLVRAAFMDTAEDLSIQVHPNEEQAAEAGDYEKSESWYILEAGEGAYITAGVSCRDKEILKKAAEENRLEEYLVRHSVKKGDFAMIPAGMVHACGKDMLVLEIGSFGGITYRLYDYGRGRQLDKEKGFDIADPTLECHVIHCQEKHENRLWTAGIHRMFRVEILDVDGSFLLKGDGHYRIAVCVDGTCEMNCEGEHFSMPYTGTILIPASCRAVELTGRCRLVLAGR